MARTELVESSQRYQQAYDHVSPAWAGLNGSRVASLRKNAIEHFHRLGFPTTRDENWKYTDVGPIAKATLETPTRKGTKPMPQSEWENARIADCIHVAITNGVLDSDRTEINTLPKGVTIQSLHEATGPSIDSAYGSVANAELNAFVALNTALALDAVVIHVEADVSLEQPIHVVHWTAKGVAAHARVLLVLEQGAHAGLVQTFTSGGPSWTNAVTEAVLADNAQLDHAHIQDQHEGAFQTSQLFVTQGRDTMTRDVTTHFGGALVRNEIHATFAGPGSELWLHGLYAPRGTQHVDNHTYVDHAHPHCTSRQLYKGVLDGKSRGVFYGKVFVRSDAQKTDADQHNHNLLLSEGALADSTPALEINADDVKASHGSTIGQLDEAAMFYLRSRGLEEATARGLLVYAFAREPLEGVAPGPVRARMDDLLVARLPNGAQIREEMA